MRRFTRLAGLIGAVSLLGIAAAPMSASADDGHDDESSAKLLLDGLNSPKGLAVNTDRDLVIAQGAFGPPDPVLVYDLHGANKGDVTPVTDPASLVDVAISPLDGTGWAIVAAVEDPPSPALLLHQLADGTVVPVLDIFAYQAGDPDPADQDDFATESNPYGLTIDKNGDALFTDAANNDLVRVTPDGVPTTVARFDLETISTDHIPGFPVPTQTAEAVPTTVTVGPDGALYVGELKGFPFRPGSSNIWRIKSDAVGATCSVNTPDSTHSCTLYKTGFTSIQDIAFNKSGSKLYVYELAAAGTSAFEEGFATGEFPPAVLLEVTTRGRGDDDGHRRKDDHGKGDRRTELAKGQLSQPGGVVVDKNGTVYVTDGMFTGGRLLKIVEDD